MEKFQNISRQVPRLGSRCSEKPTGFYLPAKCGKRQREVEWDTMHYRNGTWNTQPLPSCECGETYQAAKHIVQNCGPTKYVK